MMIYKPNCNLGHSIKTTLKTMVFEEFKESGLKNKAFSRLHGFSETILFRCDPKCEERYISITTLADTLFKMGHDIDLVGTKNAMELRIGPKVDTGLRTTPLELGAKLNVLLRRKCIAEYKARYMHLNSAEQKAMFNKEAILAFLTHANARTYQVNRLVKLLERLIGNLVLETKVVEDTTIISLRCKDNSRWDNLPLIAPKIRNPKDIETRKILLGVIRNFIKSNKLSFAAFEALAASKYSNAQLQRIYRCEPTCNSLKTIIEVMNELGFTIEREISENELSYKVTRTPKVALRNSSYDFTGPIIDKVVKQIPPMPVRQLTGWSVVNLGSKNAAFRSIYSPETVSMDRGIEMLESLGVKTELKTTSVNNETKLSFLFS